MMRANFTLFLSILCFDIMPMQVRIWLPNYSALELSSYRNLVVILLSILFLIIYG